VEDLIMTGTRWTSRAVEVFALAALSASASGCLRAYRQQGVEISLAKVRVTRDDVVDAAKAAKRITDEVKVASEEDRPPDISAPITDLVESLENAHGSCEVAGKVLTAMQADLGRSEKPVPQTDDEIVRWVGLYARARAVWGQIMSVVASRLPPMIASAVSPKRGAGGSPWSPVEIAGLITAVTAAVGATGAGARRGIKKARERRACRDAEISEALAALDELKAKHPKSVKDACDPARKPHLRSAFVRREGGAA
jgi:hypothetical protein